MAVLLTGGTGKTGTRMVPMLQAKSIPFVIASRKGIANSPATGSLPAVKFDWLDPTTFSAPFKHSFGNGEKITSIYLVSPQVADPVPHMNSFIDFAFKEHGVKRFVLLGGSTLEKGGYHTGKVWEHLDEIDVEYCVLRATWFMDNFSEWQHAATIKSEGVIYSACEDGLVQFVTASDIATLAFHNLICDKVIETSYRVLGPEPLTHDQVAEKFSKGLGREIKHVKLSPEDRTQSYLKVGMPKQFADFMVALESKTAAGFENYSDDSVFRVTGKAPQNFDSWIQENKSAWE